MESHPPQPSVLVSRPQPPVLATPFSAATAVAPPLGHQRAAAPGASAASFAQRPYAAPTAVAPATQQPPPVPVPSVAAALPMSGKALEHWMSLQRRGSSSGGAGASTALQLPPPQPQSQPPQPQPPLMSMAIPLLPLATLDSNATAVTSSASSGVGSRTGSPSPSPRNPVPVALAAALAASSATNAASAMPRRPAVMLSPGRDPALPPTETLADVVRAEGDARRALLHDAAATNFVDLAVALACVLRSDAAAAQSRRLDAEAAAAGSGQAATMLPSPSPRRAAAPSQPSQPLTVSALLRRVTANVKDVAEAHHATVARERRRRQAVSAAAVQATSGEVELVPAGALLQLIEENARLRALLQAESATLELSASFSRYLTRCCFAELRESSDALDHTLQQLRVESAARRTLEADSVVRAKQSQHAARVADEASADLAREKAAADAERRARSEVQRKLEDVNAQVDGHTLTRARLETQAARERATTRPTHFAARDRGVQVSAGGGGGGGSGSATRECGTLRLHVPTVALATELTRFRAEAACATRGFEYDRGVVELSLFGRGRGAGTLRHVTADAATVNVSVKLATVASVERPFEPDNALRLVLSEDHTHVDLRFRSRRDCECVVEALALARAHFSSRCFVPRLWGSATHPASMGPNAIEADYRVIVDDPDGDDFTATMTGGGGGGDGGDAGTGSGAVASLVAAMSGTAAGAALVAGASASVGDFGASGEGEAAAGTARREPGFYATLQRAAPCRIAWLAAADIVSGAVTQRELDDVAAAANLIVLWRTGDAGGAKDPALVSVINFGKEAFRHWRVVVSDTCACADADAGPRAASGARQAVSVQLLIAATRDTQSWIGTYAAAHDASPRTARLVLSVQVLGSRVAFVAVASHASDARESHASALHDDGALGALVRHEVFCGGADCVFVVGARALIERVAERDLEAVRPDGASSVDVDAAAVVAPLSFVRVALTEPSRDAAAKFLAPAAPSPSSIAVVACSHSFLPDGNGTTLWRPRAPAAAAAAASSVDAAPAGGDGTLWREPPHSVVLPLRRTPCSVLGQPPSTRVLIVRALTLTVAGLPREAQVTCTLAASSIEQASFACERAAAAPVEGQRAVSYRAKISTASGEAARIAVITGDRVRLAADVALVKVLVAERVGEPARRLAAFGHFSILGCLGWVPGDGEVARCALRLFAPIASQPPMAQEGLSAPQSQLAGHCVIELRC
jgi:hypothetical protein